MRHLAFFTGTRAEYSLLRPVLLKIKNTDAKLTIIASGTHLLSSYGHTIDSITADGFDCIKTPVLDEAGNDGPIYEVMGNALHKYGKILEKINPDMLVVLGDRYETFCAALASATLRVPVSHIHGGELTPGALDETFRHCITKMSHFHFTTCEEHRKRVIQLGENPERVWNFGALGVENALALPETPNGLKESLGIENNRPFFLCTVHPVTLAPGEGMALAQNILMAFKKFPGFDIVFTSSNADPEGAQITEIFREAVKKFPVRLHFFESLGFPRYLWTAGLASAVIGNSSSGMIEIPSLGIPVINIGKRQAGRVCSEAVIHCGNDIENIAAAIRQAISQEHIAKAKAMKNPYEGHEVSQCIAEVLLNHVLPQTPEKYFFDL